MNYKIEWKIWQTRPGVIRKSQDREIKKKLDSWEIIWCDDYFEEIHVNIIHNLIRQRLLGMLCSRFISLIISAYFYNGANLSKFFSYFSKFIKIIWKRHKVIGEIDSQNHWSQFTFNEIPFRLKNKDHKKLIILFSC